MTTKLRRYFHAPQVLLHYPHMLSEDTRLWTRFLRNHYPEGALAAYDLHVGTEPPFATNFPENYRHMIRALAAKRIDVLLAFPDETAVIEVKPWAGTTAIGQVITYTLLVHKFFPDLVKPFPCIITDTAQPDIPEIASSLHIVLLELDALETGTSPLPR